MFGSSPRLFAAHHVFHRSPASRHPPVALINLFLFPFQPYSIVNEQLLSKQPDQIRMITANCFAATTGLEPYDEKILGGGEGD